MTEPECNKETVGAPAAGTGTAPGPSTLTVMFDGACPLCRREVGVYRNLAPLQPISWMDVSDTANALPTGHDRARYLARFHVRTADGMVLSGAAAFVALWLTLPGWRWLGRFGQVPGVTPVLEQLYRGFLTVRPAMQGIARRLEKKSGDPTSAVIKK